MGWISNLINRFQGPPGPQGPQGRPGRDAYALEEILKVVSNPSGITAGMIYDIKIRYLCDIEKIRKIPQGDWIDLRAAQNVKMKKGEFTLIPLGIAMELPVGFEAHMAPRSSTYKNFKIIQANSVAVIDESYRGDNDQWFYPAIALEDTVIHKNDRIAQFRIMMKQPELNFIEVATLANEDRGGLGSTGIK